MQSEVGPHSNNGAFPWNNPGQRRVTGISTHEVDTSVGEQSRFDQESRTSIVKLTRAVAKLVG
jgi:transglutaminase-like putative cysteine protease